MALNAAEEESIDALKKWWEDNRSMLFTVVITLVVVIGGWTFYQNSSNSSADAASDLYEQILTLARVDSGAEIPSADAEQILALATTLKTEHAKSVYALYGALFAAQQAVNADDLSAAEQELQWVLDNSAGGLFRQTDEGLVLTAKLRLGHVILAKGETDRALELVTSTDPKTFEANFAELRGDIYLAMGRRVDAKDSYTVAQQAGSSSPFLRMKLDELASETP